MTATRRSFLRSGVITVVMAGVALDIVPSIFGQGRPPQDRTKDFPIPFEAQQGGVFFAKADTFRPYVGGFFRVSAGANSAQMKLERVTDYKPGPNADKMMRKAARKSDSFALVFSSSVELTDLTSIYDVEHAALGKFALFLTRRKGPDGTHYYEAVFNHAL